MLPGLSHEKLKEFEIRAIIKTGSEISVLVDEDVGFVNTWKFNDQYSAQINSYVDKLQLYSSEHDIGDLVVQNAYPSALLRILVTTAIDSIDTQRCTDVVQTCCHLLRCLNDGTLAPGGQSFVSKLFEDSVGVFAQLAQFVLVRIRAESSQVGQNCLELTLLIGFTEAMARIAANYSNKKKLFQLFLADILFHCLDLLNYSSLLPTELIRNLEDFMKKCLFDSEKDAEEISTCSFSPGESGRPSKQKQSYFAGLFETIYRYCSADNASRQPIVNPMSHCHADGLARILATYARCSKIHNPDDKSVSGSQAWRKHCGRVLHLSTQMMNITEHCINNLLQTKDESASGSSQGTVPWLSHATASIAATTHVLITGSLPQHKSLDAYIIALKSFACRTMRRMCKDTSKAKVLSSATPSKHKKKKARSNSDCSDNDIQSDLPSQHHIITSQVASADCLTLNNLLLIDHRIVLECLEASAPSAVEDAADATIGKPEDDNGDWALDGVKLVIQSLNECCMYESQLSLGVCTLLGLSNSGAQLSRQINDVGLDQHRLQLFKSLVDTFADLRRLDILYQALLESGSSSSDNTLGVLVASTEIQLRLSRVVMSLTPMQLTTLWNKLSLRGQERAHDCASPLLTATVRAAMLSPEINIASISLKSIARLLAQALEILIHNRASNDVHSNTNIVVVNNCVKDISQLLAVVVSRYESEVMEAIPTCMVTEEELSQVDRISDSLSTAQYWKHILHSTSQYCSLLTAEAAATALSTTSTSINQQLNLSFVLLSLSSFVLNASAAGIASALLPCSTADRQHSLLDATFELVSRYISSATAAVPTHSKDNSSDISAVTEASLQLLMKLVTLQKRSELHLSPLSCLATQLFEALFRLSIESFHKTDSQNAFESIRFGNSRLVHDSIRTAAVVDSPPLRSGLLAALQNVFKRTSTNLNDFVISITSDIPIALDAATPKQQSKSSKRKRRASETEEEGGTGMAIKDLVSKLSHVEDSFRSYAKLLFHVAALVPIGSLISSALSTESGIATTLAMVDCLLDMLCTCCSLQCLTGPIAIGFAQYIRSASKLAVDMIARVFDSAVVAEEAVLKKAVQVLTCLHRHFSVVSIAEGWEDCLPLSKLFYDKLVRTITSNLMEFKETLDLVFDPIEALLWSLSAPCSSPIARRSSARADRGMRSAVGFQYLFELLHCISVSFTCAAAAIGTADLLQNKPVLNYVFEKFSELLRLSVRSKAIFEDDSISTVDRNRRALSAFEAAQHQQQQQQQQQQEQQADSCSGSNFSGVAIDRLYGVVSVLASISACAVHAALVQQATDTSIITSESEELLYCLTKLLPLTSKCALCSYRFLRSADDEADETLINSPSLSVYQNSISVNTTQESSAAAAVFGGSDNSCGWLVLVGTCLDLQLSTRAVASSMFLNVVDAVAAVLKHVSLSLTALDALSDGICDTVFVEEVSCVRAFQQHFGVNISIGICIRGIMSFAMQRGLVPEAIRRLSLLTTISSDRFIPSQFVRQSVGSAAQLQLHSQFVSVTILFQVNEALLLELQRRSSPDLQQQTQEADSTKVELIVSSAAIQMTQCCELLWSISTTKYFVSIARRMLKLLLLGFNCFRQMHMQRSESAVVTVARPSATRDMVVQWCSAALHMVGGLYNILTVRADCLLAFEMKSNANNNIKQSHHTAVASQFSNMKNLLTLSLSVLDAVVQQSKFDSMSTTLPVFTQLLAAIITQTARIRLAWQSSGPSDLSVFRAIARTLSVCCSNQSLKKHIYLIVANVVHSLTTCKLLPNELACISNGLYPLLDRCQQREKQQIYSLLDNNGRILMDDIHAIYMRDYKFTGKA